MIWMRVVFVALAVAGCAASAAMPDVPKKQCRALSKTFFKQSKALMLHLFENAEPEEQYAMYICGNQYMHPPVLVLADAYAARGRPAADFLRRKLAMPHGDLTTRDITRVFVVMKRKGSFDARQDIELLHLIESKIGQMKQPEWKTVTAEMYSELAAGP